MVDIKTPLENIFKKKKKIFKIEYLTILKSVGTPDFPRTTHTRVSLLSFKCSITREGLLLGNRNTRRKARKGN